MRVVLRAPLERQDRRVLDDPVADLYRATDGRHLAHRVIAELHLFGQDLAEQQTFISRVGELIDTIRRHGVDAAIRDSIAASQAPMTTTGAHR